MKSVCRFLKRTEFWGMLVFDALLLGVSGSVKWNSMVLFTFVCILTGIVWMGRGTDYTISTKQTGMFAGILFLICLLLSMLTANFSESIIVLKIRELAEGAAGGLCYGSDNLPKGHTTAVREDAHGVVRLVVESSKSTELYLKGYAGSTYRDGQWKAKREAECDEKYDGMAVYLKGRGFEPLNPVDTKMDVETVHVKVENKSAGRRYVYAPIGCEKPSVPTKDTGNICDTMLAAGIFNPSEYEFDVWQKAPRDESNAYKECEQIYRSFVYENYLEIPAGWDKERLGHMGGNTAEEVVQSVRSYLSEEKENWTSYEYASEAALLFRYCGIPARYTEGYYVGVSDYNEKMQVNVTDSNRHAWVEIYVDGIGFVTCEVTPGRYVPAISTDDIAVGSSGIPKGNKVHLEEGQSKSEKTEHKGVHIWLAIAVVLGSILIAGVLVLMKRHKKREDRKKLDFSDRLCESLDDSLKRLGIRVDFKRPYESEEMIEALYGTKAGNCYHYLMNQIDRERFLQEKAESNEQRHFLKVSNGFLRDISKRRLDPY